jgi:hypothetical protein
MKRADRCRVNAERTRHPEMHDQDIAGSKVSHQEFCPSTEADNPLSNQAHGKIGLKRETKVGAAQFDTRDTRAFHHRLQAPANGFNFRKFRHVGT